MYQMSLHNKIEQLIIVATRCDVRRSKLNNDSEMPSPFTERRKDDGSHSLINQDSKNKIVTHN